MQSSLVKEIHLPQNYKRKERNRNSKLIEERKVNGDRKSKEGNEAVQDKAYIAQLGKSTLSRK